MKNYATLDGICGQRRRYARLGISAILFVALVFALTARTAVPVQAAPGAAGQTGAIPAVSTAHFTFGGNAAEIAATFLGHLVLFPAGVNESRPLLLELDSSAPLSSIDMARGSEMGLGNLSGASLRLSGVDLMLPGFMQGTNETFAATTGRVYEGRLGKDFLDQLVVKLDYARQTAQVYDPASFRYSGQGKAFPLRFEGAMPVVRAKFNLGGKSYEADFGVNTAVEAPVRISQRYAQAHKFKESHLRTFSSTDEPLNARAEAVRLRSFEIGPFMALSPMGEIADTALPGKLAGEIGGGMLQRFIVIFDYTHQQMILEPGNSFPNDDPGDMSGISLVAKGPTLKTFEVASVAPGTPGADAKIQNGDVIAGVDADAAADLTLMDVRNLFRQVGHTYKLLVERNGQEITVSITMRRLL
jgi:hypothetical protein